MNGFLRTKRPANARRNGAMRRGLFFLLPACLLVSLFLCGCAKKSAPPSVAQSFSCNAEIVYDTVTARAKLHRDKTGRLELALSAPRELNGIKLIYDREVFKVTYFGLEITGGEQSRQLSSAAKAIFDCLEYTAGRMDLQAVDKGGSVVVKGQTDLGEYQMTFDKQNNAITALKIDAIKLTCSFSDFKIG